jgi:hypothetical protein
VLFALIVFLTIGVGAAIVYAWNHKEAFLLVGLIGGAVVDTLIIAITLATFAGGGIRAALSRALERAWAVIIIFFAVSYIQSVATYTLAAGNIIDRILAIILLLFAASLIFAEVIAVTIDDERWWMLVPAAFGTSVRVTWSGSLMWRALALFALNLVPDFLASSLGSAMAKAHLPQAEFWSTFPLHIIWSVPFNVLITLVLFDVTGYEPKHPCDE